MDFEAFVEQVAAIFGFDPDGLAPESRLHEDLGLDSLQLLELLDRIEAEAPSVAAFEPDPPGLRTLGQAHEHLLRCLP